MSKNSRKWDESKFKRYLKEGRGSGEGSNYKPWINVQDFASLGRSSKAPSWKNRRSYQFLSDNELRYFYLLEWSDIVTDIREQFPLLDIEEALKTAKEIGVKYPTDNESGMPYVMTADFMITLNINGQISYVARTVKPYSELQKMRVLEKLEIERRYWQRKGIDWGIVTENEIPKVMAKNIEWVHPYYYPEIAPEIELLDVNSIAELLKIRLNDSNCAFTRVTRDVDKELHLETGTALSVLRHLIARKEVMMDMTKKIEIGKITTIVEKVSNNGSLVIAK